MDIRVIIEIRWHIGWKIIDKMSVMPQKILSVFKNIVGNNSWN